MCRLIWSTAFCTCPLCVCWSQLAATCRHACLINPTLTLLCLRAAFCASSLFGITSCDCCIFQPPGNQFCVMLPVGDVLRQRACLCSCQPRCECHHDCSTLLMLGYKWSACSGGRTQATPWHSTPNNMNTQQSCVPIQLLSSSQIGCWPITGRSVHQEGGGGLTPLKTTAACSSDPFVILPRTAQPFHLLLQPPRQLPAA